MSDGPEKDAESTLMEYAINELRRYIDRVYKGNVSAAKKDFGMTSSTLDKWLNGDRKPSFSKLAPILEKLQAKIVFPDKNASASREVRLVRIESPLPNGELPVEQDTYTAVPLLSDAGAGIGVIWNEYQKPKEWFLVNRKAQSMLGRSVEEFFAVRVDARSTSMEPTLHPGDTVLVDPTDTRIESPGGIFLVMDPKGRAKIKRVNVEKVPDLGSTRIIFYSDNVQEYPPEVHILERDYDSNIIRAISRAIAGRVIWAWTDLSRK